jgi:hypothetical protein
MRSLGSQELPWILMAGVTHDESQAQDSTRQSEKELISMIDEHNH